MNERAQKDSRMHFIIIYKQLSPQKIFFQYKQTYLSYVEKKSTREKGFHKYVSEAHKLF